MSEQELWALLGDDLWKYNTDKLSESEVTKILDSQKDKKVFVDKLFGTGKEKKQSVTVNQLSEFSKTELKDVLSLENFKKSGRPVQIDQDKNVVGLEPIRKMLRKRENIAKEEDTIKKVWAKIAGLNQHVSFSKIQELFRTKGEAMTDQEIKLMFGAELNSSRKVDFDGFKKLL